MPRTAVCFYQEEPGDVPVWDWLTELLRRDRRAFAKCVRSVLRLAELGHELRRPEADYLRDEIYELRARLGTVNFRLLYFFHGRDVAVLAHSLTKGQKVPDRDIERALARKTRFRKDPEAHTFYGDLP